MWVSAKTLNPNVKFWTTGSPSDANPIWSITRPLYIYFRDVDVFNDTVKFEPGGTLNWVRALLYNPCAGTGHTTGCSHRRHQLRPRRPALHRYLVGTGADLRGRHRSDVRSDCRGSVIEGTVARVHSRATALVPSKECRTHLSSTSERDSR